MSESALIKQLQIEASKLGARLFRNQVGCYRVDGRWISSGLCVGSSDLIGWQTITITPEMVGKRIAVFMAIEGKTKTGRLTDEQKSFISAVNFSGGISFVARTVDEFIRGLGEWGKN